MAQTTKAGVVGVVRVFTTSSSLTPVANDVRNSLNQRVAGKKTDGYGPPRHAPLAPRAERRRRESGRESGPDSASLRAAQQSEAPTFAIHRVLPPRERHVSSASGAPFCRSGKKDRPGSENVDAMSGALVMLR